MGEKKSSGISRREFARRAAMASAAASLAPVEILGAESGVESPEPQQPPELPKLTPEGQAEVEARIHAILSQYGGRFSEAQKADIRRLCALRPLALLHDRKWGRASVVSEAACRTREKARCPARGSEARCVGKEKLRRSHDASRGHLLLATQRACEAH